MPFDKRTLVLPAGTRFEEHMIVTVGDVILGNQVKLAYGLKTEGRIFAGQGVHVDGDLQCQGDIRIDQSSHIIGGLEGGSNIYLGERCFVQGDLALEGDLDVGDDVRIGGQLKAKGWVNKRNPVPLVLYVFIYLLELLRMGQSEEVERILKELEDADDAEIAVDEVFLFIPDGSEVGEQHTDVKGGLLAKEKCRILGNVNVEGDVEVGWDTKVCGALRATGDIVLRRGSEVQGDLKAGGKVVVGQECNVLGDLHARSVEMYSSSTVDGRIIADEGIRFRSEEQDRRTDTAVEKIASVDRPDLVDLLG